MHFGPFTLTAAILVTSVSAVPVSYTSDGHLQVMESSNNVLKAIYYTQETGIRIQADSTSLTLTSMINDEVLLAASKPHGSTKLVSILGSSFIQYTTTDREGEPRKEEFLVPESMMEQAKEAVENRKEERLISQLEGNDETETHTASQRAFERLFTRPELGLLMNASNALGRAGIMGYANQGALNFYGVAIAVVKQQLQNEGSGEESLDSGEVGLMGRFKRLWWRYEWCSNVDHYCRRGRCPRGRYCAGRCGPNCWWCWWYVCLSCCYQQGCYDHDVCCGERGFFTTECLIPLPFSCSGYDC